MLNVTEDKGRVDDSVLGEEIFIVVKDKEYKVEKGALVGSDADNVFVAIGEEGSKEVITLIKYKAFQTESSAVSYRNSCNDEDLMDTLKENSKSKDKYWWWGSGLTVLILVAYMRHEFKTAGQIDIKLLFLSAIAILLPLLTTDRYKTNN